MAIFVLTPSTLFCFSIYLFFITYLLSCRYRYKLSLSKLTLWKMSGEHVKVYLADWKILRVRHDAWRLDSFKLGHRRAGIRLLSLHEFKSIILLAKCITIADSTKLSILLDEQSRLQILHRLIWFSNARIAHFTFFTTSYESCLVGSQSAFLYFNQFPMQALADHLRCN